MRKVIGIGETILDIIFEGNQPSAAVPGGSVFNGIVSLETSSCNSCVKTTYRQTTSMYSRMENHPYHSHS